MHFALALALLQSSTLDAPAPARLDEFQGELEALAERYHLPGLSAAIVHRREVVWSVGIGYADFEAELLATPDTRYRLASLSKPLAAVLVLQLVEQGKLDLDAPMRDFHVPKWFAPDPQRYAEAPILLRHVLTHTSEGEHPGQTFSYNGNIYSDLTWVLEEVTHTAYPRLLEERVFRPAGMERSLPGHTRAGATELGQLARPYAWDGDEFVRQTWQMMDPDPALDLVDMGPVFTMPAEGVALRTQWLGEGFMHLNAGSAAGEVTSTVLDLARFDVALDGGKLVTAESRARMWTPAKKADGSSQPYALGWFVEEFEGRRAVWHYGWLPPGVSALYLKLPDEELTFLLLANSDGLSREFAWTREGVRASPFARAFLTRFDGRSR